LQEEILAGELRAYTAATVTDPRRLRALLADVRRGGAAVCPGYIDERATGIAVPLRDTSGQVRAALSAVVPNDGAARTQLPALKAALVASRGHWAVRAPVERRRTCLVSHPMRKHCLAVARSADPQNPDLVRGGSNDGRDALIRRGDRTTGAGARPRSPTGVMALTLAHPAGRRLPDWTRAPTWI